MSKINALEFAKYVDINRKSLIQHCKKNGKYLKDNESLGYIVSLNNTINLAEKSSDLPVRNVYNYDGTLLESTIVNIGDAVTLPTEPPVIDDPKISFKKWVKSTISPTVKTSYNIGAICQVNEQIDIDGTLVRPTLIEVVISEAIGLSPMIRWQKETNSSVLYIDWGDGAIDTVSTSATSGNTTHTYQVAGRYTIKMYSLNSYSISTSGSSNYSFGSIEYQKIVRKVYFGDNIRNIGRYAFYYCYSLQSIVIPDNITSIAEYAFGGCHSLQSAVISNGVTSIGTSAFTGCDSLQSVIIPDSVISIGGSAFVDCNSLQSVIIPDSVTSIGNNAFKHNYSLQSAVIPDSVTSIETQAFSGCYSLKSVVIPNRVTSIKADTFSYCYSLQSIVIPDNVTSIERSAFTSCCSLQSAVIPNGVTSIDAQAFSSCYSLRSIVIPDNWNQNMYFIKNCYNLEDSSWVSIANKISDLTNTNAKVISINNAQKSQIDTIMVNSSGEEDATGTMTLTEFIQNKNWTISVSN